VKEALGGKFGANVAGFLRATFEAAARGKKQIIRFKKRGDDGKGGEGEKSKGKEKERRGEKIDLLPDAYPPSLNLAI